MGFIFLVGKAGLDIRKLLRDEDDRYRHPQHGQQLRHHRRGYGIVGVGGRTPAGPITPEQTKVFQMVLLYPQKGVFHEEGRGGGGGEKEREQGAGREQDRGRKEFSSRRVLVSDPLLDIRTSGDLTS